MVHRRRGPYRLLYVSGRPNWEFKFLRRALQGEDEIELVGLIRYRELSSVLFDPALGSLVRAADVMTVASRRSTRRCFGISSLTQSWRELN